MSRPVNLRGLSGPQLRRIVEKAVKGAAKGNEAAERVRNAFSSQPLVWVTSLGAFQWKVLIKPFPNSGHYEFICDR